jgi:nucleotide-binding universal stress UspA family protein
MTKTLLTVDDSKASQNTLNKFVSMFKPCLADSIILLYVEKIEGQSLMDELLLSDSEMATLKESLRDTDHQEKLDRKAAKVLDYCSKTLAEHGLVPQKTIIKEGHPAEEILKTAQEEEADLIVMGSRSRRLHNLFMGSVSREVANSADISIVLIK